MEHNVAASAQQQALAAMLFLSREALEMELPRPDDVARAKKPRPLPAASGTRSDLTT